MRLTWPVRLLAVFAVCALAPVLALKAQENPASGITDLRAEVVFPAVVRLFVRFGEALEPPEVVLLSMSQEERTLFSGPVTLIAVPQAEDASLWRFDWPIPLDDAPRLFVPVHYRWEMVDATGSQQEAESEFLFAPETLDFRHGGEPPLSFSVGSSDLNLRLAREVVLPAYTLMAEQTGLQPEFRWAVLPPAFAFCSEAVDADGQPMSIVLAASPVDEPDVYACREEDAERLFASSGYQILRRRERGLLPFENELVDAMFEVFYRQYWEGKDVPAWFRTGLRRYLHVNPDPLAVRYLQTEGRAGRLFNAEQMQSGPPEADQQLWELQAHSLVLFLADQYGAQAPLRLARDAAALAWDDAWRDLTGSDLRGMMARWERWLFGAAAVRAGSWFLYGPATATPTVTRTATAVPPTRTPAPVVTVSPQPGGTPVPETATLLGTPPLTSTGVPAVLPTATNTPRPPGSLAQPQPTPPEPGGGICATALPALLLPCAAFVTVERRKKNL